MKKFLCAITVLTMTCFGAPAAAKQVDGTSTAFIASLGEAVVAILENPSLSPAERVVQYSAQFKKAFDWDRISAYAIGEHQRRVSRGKFNEYRELFAQHMTKLYARKFADYSGETFQVESERQFGRGGSEVIAVIRDTNERTTAKLAFKLVKDRGEQRIYDVMIDGVSLLKAKRSEMKGIIAAGGIDGLIKQLKRANTN